VKTSSAFLIMFDLVNKYVLGFLREVLPDIMNKEGNSDGVESSVGALTKTSTFGEAEVEVRFPASLRLHHISSNPWFRT
jgi:hypothetical protein